MKKLLGCVLLVLGGSAAMADIPPPPETLQRYTVEVSSAVSEILLQNLRFTTVQVLPLPKEGPFGPCTAEARSLEQTGPLGKSTLSCQNRTSCFYKLTPKCTLTFVDVTGRVPQDIVRILSATPIAGNPTKE